MEEAWLCCYASSCALVLDQRPDAVGVIGLVGENDGARTEAVEQAIVYMDHALPGTPTRIFEASAPQQFAEVLAKTGMDRVEVSRTQGDLLLISYNSDDGQQTLAGTWRLPSSSSPGGWESPSLAGRTIANRAVFSCDDSYLIYGSSSKSGAQNWYARDLPSGIDQIIGKVTANAEPQSWSGCPATSTTIDPFQFRVVPR